MGRCQAAQVSSDADSKRKPDVAADSVFKAAFEQQTATEAQKLEEVVAQSAVQEDPLQVYDINKTAATQANSI